MTNYKMISGHTANKLKLGFISLCFLTLSSIAANAQEVEKVTLEQAVAIALENNIQIKQAKLSESTSEINLSEAKFALYPTLNGNSSLNFNNGRSIDPLTNQFVNNSITSSNSSLFSSVNLFQGFQRINQISRNKLQLQADKSQVAKAQNDLSLSVVTSYLQILVNQDLLSAANNQLGIAKETLEREQKLFDVGNRTLADLAQAKAQFSTAELNITNAQNQLDISFLNLAQLMERNPAVPFDILRPSAPNVESLQKIYSANEVFNQALAVQPDIKLAEFNKLVAAKAVDVAKGNLSPRLSLNGSLGTGYSNGRQRLVSSTANGNRPIGLVENTNQVVVVPAFTNLFEVTPFQDQISENVNRSFGFSLSIPILNGLQATNSIKRAKINLQNQIYGEQLVKNTLNKTINQAVLDIRAADKRYLSASRTFEANKEAYNVIEQRYNVGLVNSLDLSTSKANLDKAEFDVIQAKYDLLFRVKVIDFYLGNPLTL
jgi:outer membrane protein